MVQYVNRTGCARVCGTEVLTYRISLPQWDRLGKISAFYLEIENRTRSFCETALKTMAEEDFERSDDPKKRFCFPTFRYVLEACVTYENVGEDLLSVRLVTELRRRGSVDCLERHLQAHTWSLSEEILIPPEQIAERLMGNARIPRNIRKNKDVLVDGGVMTFLNGSVWEKFHGVESLKQNRKI